MPAGWGRRSRRRRPTGRRRARARAAATGPGTSSRSALSTATTCEVGSTPSRSSWSIVSMCVEHAGELGGHPVDLLVGQPQPREPRDVADLVAVDHPRHRSAAPGALVAQRADRGREQQHRRAQREPQPVAAVRRARAGSRSPARRPRRRTRPRARPSRRRTRAAAPGSGRVSVANTSARPASAASAAGISVTVSACQAFSRPPRELEPGKEQRHAEQRGGGRGEDLRRSQPAPVDRHGAKPTTHARRPRRLRGEHRVAQQARDRHRPDASGDRRDRARALRRGGEVDVADEPALEPVDADVDHDRARLDPVALDHLRAADRGDQHIGAAHTPPAGRGCANGRS